MSKKTIYYPNPLNASSYGDYKTLSKTIFSNNDENECFKGALFVAINKTIELAYFFDTVYLDYIDYIFIVSDIINNYHNVPSIMDMVKNKIAYIDGDLLYLSYRKHDDNDWRIAVSGKPIQDSNSIFDEIKGKVKVDIDFDIVQASINNRLCVKKISFSQMTQSCYLEIKNGYYQSFSLNENGCLYINDDNHQFYDLILSNFRNTYLWKEYGIDSIYCSEYEGEIEKRRCEFINNVGYLDVDFLKPRVLNVCLLLAENNYNPPFKNGDPSLPYKNIQQIVYKGRSSTHYSYSSNYLEDYNGKTFNIIFDNGMIKSINYLPFNDYVKGLNQSGVLQRTTRLLVKVIPSQYVKDFVEKGKIRFSKPIEWVNHANISIGKGDFNEGMIKPTIDSEEERKRLDCALNENYGWCCFGLDNLLFTKTVVFNGKTTKEAKIKKQFFDDFNVNKNYKMLFINPEKFHARLLSFIKNTDYSFDKVLCSPITYISKKLANLKAPYPFELFYKDISFIHQNEIRFLLQKDASSFYKKLSEAKGIIEIGDLTDIVTVKEIPDSDLTFVLDGDKAYFY